jgi:hypothetical protein
MIDPATIDGVSDSDLRAMFKAFLAEQQGRPEPVGIDAYSHLPVFLAPPECPRCLPFSEMYFDPVKRENFALCHDCSKPIPHPTWEFGGRGVESATVDHLHTHDIQKASGNTAVRTLARRELCLPCFRIDWAKAHPDKPCDL